METNFNDLQNMWKLQKATSTSSTESLIEGLKRRDRINKRERIALTISFALSISVLFISTFYVGNIFYTIGIILISIGMVIFLWQIFESKLPKSHQNFDANTKDFATKQIYVLKNTLNISAKYIWVYAAFIIIGLNISYIGFVKFLPVSVLIAINLFFTVGLFYIFYYSIKKRKQKNREEILPLIARLEDMLT